MDMWEVYGNSLYFLFNIAVNLKLPQKLKSIKNNTHKKLRVCLLEISSLYMGKLRVDLGMQWASDSRSADLEVVVLSTMPYLPRKMSASPHP